MAGHAGASIRSNRLEEGVPFRLDGTGGVEQPDLSAIVQEIVNRAGWSSGQSMVFVITGSGKRTASAFEAGPAKAVKLHIEYSP